MIKKLVLFVFTIVMIGCSSSKPVARTSKPYKKNTATASNQRKQPSRQVVTRKPSGQNSTDIKSIERNYEAAKESGKSNGKETVYSKEEILEATTRVKVTTAMVMDYIDQYKGIAQSNMAQYKIPASIIIGQGILESGAGTGPLSILANNHFGIKCHKEWTGPSVRYDDDEAQECFRQYDKPSESYKDHALFLTSRSRYASLFNLDGGDYKAWAKGLKAAGYATDPKYPEKLIGIIERYQLYQYDDQMLGIERALTPKKQDPVYTASTTSYSSDDYQVIKGDTLYSISKKFNISVDDLRSKNNIQDNAISIGQNLKVK